jgi:hypothetical protein
MPCGSSHDHTKYQRPVDISKPAYKVAREYMIRLEREDFENPERLGKLARTASSRGKPLSTEAFRKKFGHVVAALGGGF